MRYSDHDYYYVVFRLTLGALFFMHGASKVFGMEIVSGPYLLAGLFELVAGLFIFVGLFSRYVAYLAAVEVLVAYFRLWTGLPFFPTLEIPILYFVSFCVILSHGGGRLSLEQWWLGKEIDWLVDLSAQ